MIHGEKFESNHDHEVNKNHKSGCFLKVSRITENPIAPSRYYRPVNQREMQKMTAKINPLEN